MIEGAIFDLGGVLIDWNPRHLYRKLFNGDEQKVERFLSDVCSSAWNEQQDVGRALTLATAEKIAEFPEWEREIRAYYDRWVEMVGGSVPGTEEILGDLARANVRLFALSNWSVETFPLVKDDFPPFGYFEKIFLSGAFGLAKPDARFFEAALAEIAIPRAKLIFIDDNPANVLAAQSLGLPAIQFTDAAALKRDLQQRGLLGMG